jgi:hypothetical protein
MQKDSMDERLKNALWNAAYERYWSHYSNRQQQHATDIREGQLLYALWTEHFSQAADEFPDFFPAALGAIKRLFVACQGASVYDFVQFIARCGTIIDVAQFVGDCNNALAKHNSRFRFVGNTLAPSTSDAEFAAVDDAAALQSKGESELFKHVPEETASIDQCSSKDNQFAAPRIFISHSRADTDLATALTDLLRTALTMPANAIRCTSVLAHSLPYGIDATEQLRDEVCSAQVMVGLVTPSSVESHWVLFEMGSRWGQKKSLFCVLARGADFELLPDPIRHHHALKVTAESAGVEKFVEELADLLGIVCPSSWQYRRFTHQFISASLTLSPMREGTVAVAEPETKLERFKKRYRYEETVCWKYDANGKRDGPFCPDCVAEGNERRLNPGATKGTYTCVAHDSSYRTAEYNPQWCS